MNVSQIVRRYPAGQDGYILVRLADGRLTQEHRVVMAVALGRQLKTHEIVRHLDGDRANNDISNLMLDHRGESGAPRTVELVCAACHQPFTRRAALVNLSIKRGQYRFCCSRTCVGRAFGRAKLHHE